MPLSPRTLRYLSAYALLLCVIAVVALSTWPELANKPLVYVALVPLVLTATAYPSLRHLLPVPGSRCEKERAQSSTPDPAASPQLAPGSGLRKDELVGLLDSPARQALFAATIATLVIVLAFVTVLQPALDRA
ncbi:hypothetical protein [Rathayibacter festucae]|uniref:hypothetical protein n=1 Tax=Rathayibacter festucae TaxID=110937 RepID=UPI002A6B7BCF|nr:hypothetical protein [Rathayibacter festucae]MDY0912308.1 hypothetical protein [Rathayibacter festucae]